MSQHPVELLFGDGQPLPVGAVHHQNDELQRQKKIYKNYTGRPLLQQRNMTTGGHIHPETVLTSILMAPTG